MKWINAIFYFFPVQIALLQFKKNTFILLLWILLFGIVVFNFGAKLGIPYLFLDPEYLGEIDYKSTFLIGVFLAFFIGAFNIATFILDGYRYVFLVFSKNTFINYCANNSLIPIIFICSYIYRFYMFQLNYESQNKLHLIGEIASFIGGMILVSIIMYVFFTLTNKNWIKFIAGNIEETLKKGKYNRSVLMHNIVETKNSKNRVDYYYEFPFKIVKVKPVLPHRVEKLLKVFDQNHLYAIIFQLITFIIISIVVFFGNNNYFQLPAAVSILLLFTIISMFLGFIYYWLKNWYLIGILGVIVSINMLYESRFVNTKYYINSLDYSNPISFKQTDLLDYNRNIPKTIDSLNTIQILEKWKSKYPKEIKPKMVLICVSGGGMRASLWSFKTLQYLDKEFDQSFAEQSTLITGASGGMIGAAYFRELVLLRNKNEIKDLQDNKLSSDLSKDILNAMALKMLINDPIGSVIPFFKTIDRGQAFEKQFNINTNNILNKDLKSYEEDEKNARIPMIIMSPSIVENSTKLFISSQGVSYMVHEDAFSSALNGIEYNSYFKLIENKSLDFVTALRMNASFPYISPVISLPTKPEISTTDAGVTDTYGVKDALLFSSTFKDWINKNTSGVVLVTIRDGEKYSYYNQFERESAFFETVYDKYFDLQDLYNDQLINQAKNWLNSIEVVSFEYASDPKNSSEISRKAALSWHLTGLEKENIAHSINNKQNLKSLVDLKKLLNNQTSNRNEK